MRFSNVAATTECAHNLNLLAAALKAIPGEVFSERGKHNPPTTRLFDNRSVAAELVT
jgi:hypothetical protein